MQREFNLGDLNPGQYKDVEFNIVTTKRALHKLESPYFEPVKKQNRLYFQRSQ